MEVMGMIVLVLVRRDRQKHVQYAITLREMGPGISNHSVVLLITKFVDGAGRIKSEKLREPQQKDEHV